MSIRREEMPGEERFGSRMNCPRLECRIWNIPRPLDGGKERIGRDSSSHISSPNDNLWLVACGLWGGVGLGKNLGSWVEFELASSLQLPV